MSEQPLNGGGDPAAEHDDTWLDAILEAADRQLRDYVSVQIGADTSASDREPPAAPPGSDLGLAAALTRQLNRAVDLGLDLELALNRSGGSGRSRPLAHAMLSNLLLARDFEPATASRAELTFALDAPPTPDRLDAARTVGRSRHLDFARAIARSLARDLAGCPGEARDLAEHLVRVVDGARDLVLGHAIICRIAGIASINASGADLSQLLLHTTAVPAGMIWSVQTKWPADMGQSLLAFSRVVVRGAFCGALMIS
jgi:hypothetical protein